ncbi:MAG: UDP-2,4-diacetamido-2,4,6-trideoxy-beta-L-altropyranose hydrolase [Deltaproteobacteria bacterium]|nr:UDP-2,4-diacetamido-2,4,6-trideoxy-beta-L-altropyranose hydrolase [Deltaproteobacteria bacterium]
MDAQRPRDLPQNAPLHVALRVDASALIGTGHLVRCLTLAAALRSRGARCTFVCRHAPPALVERVHAAGHGLLLLPGGADVAFVPGADEPPHAAWLGQPWARDAADTAAALAPGGWDWLVVDHYALDRRWEEAVAPLAQRLLVIDDLADRPHACDLLLDQNLQRDMDHRYDGLLPTTCARLLGPAYALLRPEFAAARASRAASPPAPRRLFVFFGGADPNDMTSRALDALDNVEDIELDVVIGSLHPKRAQLLARCAAHPGWSCAVDVHDMAARMARAAVGVGAGGTTTWERCAVGLPSVVVSVAHNQVEIAAACAAAGVQLDLGWGPALSTSALRGAVVGLLHSAADQRRLGAAAAATCDGLGADRVAAALCGPRALQLRPASMEDAATLFSWANDPAARAASVHSAPVPWEGHLAWLQARVDSPQHAIFILEHEGAPAGVVRFADEGARWRLSYSLAPEARGRGLGRALVQRGLLAIAGKGPTAVLAEVKADNIASLLTFRRLGWAESPPDSSAGLHQFTTARPPRPEPPCPSPSLAAPSAPRSRPTSSPS